MRTPFTCIERGIWDHRKFRPLSRVGKLVYMYVNTSSYGNSIGCFKAGILAMAEDMGESLKDFQEGFQEGLEMGCFKYDEDSRVVLIPKYIHHNPPNNPNVLKGWGKLFLVIPDSELKSECYSIIEDYCDCSSESLLKAFHEAFEKPPESLSGSLPKAQGQGQGQGKGQGQGSVSKPKTSSKSNIDVEFEHFWSVYPQKTGKKYARQCFEKARKSDLPKIETLVAIVTKQVMSGHFIRNGKECTPNPSTWLNQGRWDDEVVDSRASHRAPSQKKQVDLDDWARRKEQEIHDAGGDSKEFEVGFGQLPEEIRGDRDDA